MLLLRKGEEILWVVLLCAVLDHQAGAGRVVHSRVVGHGGGRVDGGPCHGGVPLNHGADGHPRYKHMLEATRIRATVSI